MTEIEPDFLYPLPPQAYDFDFKTWKSPPLDGSLTVSELYDWHEQYNPDHPLFVYQHPAKLQRVQVPISEVVPASRRAARHVASLANIDLNNGPKPLIAILASTDTISFFTTELGLLRAEIPFFPISPRNSVAAISHLLSKTRATHILVSVEAPLRDLVKKSIDGLDFVVTMADMPTFPLLFESSGNLDDSPLPPRKRDIFATRLMVHSSGSTSFPKPIKWTDKSFLQACITPRFGKHNLCGKVFGCQALAMFHGIGLNHMGWAASTGLTIATFAPASPAAIPTTDAVYGGYLDTQPNYAFCIPSFFDEWSKDEAKLPFFKTLSGIVYGGGPLSTASGDYFVKHSVPVYTLYGTSETGVMGMLFPDDPKEDWEYMTMNPHSDMDFVDLGDGTHECVVIGKPTTEIAILNTTHGEFEAYATSDVFVKHPHKDAWKLLGRKDDQIMLSTGEKTNPGPLEAILIAHPMVKAAVMFGRGRFQGGVLVEPSPDCAFDPANEQKLAEYRNAIWPAVEELNAFAPAHSRLFKEMILVVSPSKPFVYNPKGAPKRSPILAEYEQEIEALYKAVEEGVGDFVEGPEIWTLDASMAFTREVIQNSLKKLPADGDDVFDHGCDSLQATYIRQSFLAALRSQPDKSLRVGPNFVYEFPTISLMAEFCCTDLGNKETKGPKQILEGMLDKYTTHTPFPRHHVAPKKFGIFDGFKSERDVVLITGTTGALGSAVLAKMVKSDSVATVYAVNRTSRDLKSVMERQKEALIERGYDASIASSPKVVLLEADFTSASLGLSSQTYEEIRRTVTHIIHIAWRVDFNLSLSSFEGVIKGVRVLVDLALSSARSTPPRFVFTSSIGVMRNVPSRVKVLEEPLNDAETPLGGGYGESKWVGEQILYRASKSTPLRPVVVRVGQISGGINGAWHTTDWVPIIAKTSATLGVFPDMGGMCSWIPLDLAAAAVFDFRNAEVLEQTVHLMHPRPVASHTIFELMAKSVNASLVPYDAWFKRVEEKAIESVGSTAVSSDDLPALKLLEFFRAGTYSEQQAYDPIGIPLMDSLEAYRVSPSLQEAFTGRLGQRDVQLWFKYWKKAGFIV